MIEQMPRPNWEPLPRRGTVTHRAQIRRQSRGTAGSATGSLALEQDLQMTAGRSNC
jgi:hypothetical protein